MPAPVIAANQYQPENGKVLWKSAKFLQATLMPELPEPFFIPGFVLLNVVSANPFKALAALDIVRVDLMVDSAYQCPYTGYNHYGIVPTAVVSDNVETYRSVLERNGVDVRLDHCLDHDFHRDGQTAVELVTDTRPQKGLFALSSIQRSFLGTGYTVGEIRLKTDGCGEIKQGKINLDNGDWLYVHFWEWYDK